MAEVIVGREAELETAEQFLDGIPAGRSALFIEGMPGIGKTTIWRETVRRASARGHRVLFTRPAEAEAKLSYAGLADLIGGLDRELFESLPQPQREALDVALSRRSGEADRRTLFAAFVSLLISIAATGATVLAIDDVQWLDGPSAAALGFAVRRLGTSPIGILAAVRVGERSWSRTFERAFDSVGVLHVRVGPLSLASLHHLIVARLGRTFARPTLVRLEQASGGNPLFALEIARELNTTGDLPPGEPLPVPQDLEAMIRARVRRLPAPTRAALLTLASVARPTVDLVEPYVLGPAEDAELIRVEADGRVSFVHPLYASAVYRTASAERRRAEHSRLATSVRDPEERAWHLALANEEPDERVSAELWSAAVDTAARGSPDAATALGRLAIRITPEPLAGERARRQIVLAEWLWISGDPRQARDVVTDVIESARSGAIRCDALLALANIRWEDSKRAAVQAAEAGVAAAANDRQMAQAHLAVANACSDLDLSQATMHARAALALLDPDREPYTYADCTLKVLWWTLLQGLGGDQEAFDRAIRLRASTGTEDLDPAAPLRLLAYDDLRGARPLWEDLLRVARTHGSEYAFSYFSAIAAQTDLWLGDWPAATREADLGVELAELTDSPTRLAHALFARALVVAHQGDLDHAREDCKAILDIAVLADDPWFECAGASTLGFVELSAGDHARADVAFSRAEEATRRMGMAEPVRFRFHGDQIEVAVALGQLDRADVLVAELERRGRVLPRPWTLAIAARSSGLVLAARGDLDAAVSALDAAVAHHAGLEMPFELARTLLLRGVVHRRRREKRLARESIQAAQALFEDLGAAAWAARARSELARVVARQAPLELTPTESQVAALAAAGRTNRDIASALFMSPKTVEKRLASVYGKLGIGSRAELGARTAGHPPEEDAAKT